MATLITYDEFTADEPPRGGTIQEIVLSEVTDLISRRRPLLGSIGSKDVPSTFVELLTDSLRTRAANITVEGAAFTDPNLTQPTRHFVHVQSFAEWGIISDEQRMTAHYNEDPFVYQTRKSMEQMLNDVEHALHRGSAASGASGVGRQFDGLLNLFGTTTFTSSSGTTLAEDVMIDYLQAFRDNNLDVVPSQCYVNALLKRTISEFSTRVTRNVDAVDRMQTLIIERHASDFGDLDVLYSEDQLQAVDRTSQGNSIVFLDPNHFDVGWFRRPTVERLARDGLRDRYQMNAQATLLFRNQDGGGGADGIVSFINQA